jgi:riboflavin kinase/FMN adenylyltransferase
MELITDLHACPDGERGTAVTIGFYDGVHRGHQALIAHVRELAAQRGCASAIVTFDRHPATVVRPSSAPRLLTDLEQRVELLAASGIDYCVVVHFDEERAAEPAEDFVSEVLVGCLSARVVAVGEDFHFGRGRGGNVALLQKLGPGLGFEVVPFGLVEVPGLDEPVSSTAVRALLTAGEVERAAVLLGRPHEVRGVVERGDGRGRELGFPTANVAVPSDILLPADGIYAGWYERPSGAVAPTAISLGRRPTFYADAAKSLLEAHLLDSDADLYGESARVRFVARLRGEARFESVDELVAQMWRDVAATRDRLSSRDGPLPNAPR